MSGNGNHNILQRQQPSFAKQTGTYSDGRPIYTFTANPDIANTSQPYNVMDYGALGDGVTDDTAAIQAAINACAAAGGGIVYLPVGVYRTSATLILAGDNVILQGAGGVGGNTNASRLGATIVKPSPGATYDAIGSALPPTPGTAGYVVYGVGVRDLVVDCSQMTGTVAGQGNGIHLYGVRYGSLSHVDVFSCPNWAFLSEGDVTNFSYNTDFYSCIAGGCAGGWRFTYSEQCNLYRCIVEGAALACAAAQPYGSSASTVAYQLYMNSGWTRAQACTFGTSGAYTAAAVCIDNGETCTVDACLFDSVHGTAILTNAGGHCITDNAIDSPNSTTAGAAISLGGAAHSVRGNIFQNVSGFMTVSIEERGAFTPANVIEGNQLIAGTVGMVTLYAGSRSVVAHNPGYNPVGHLSVQPAVPASTVAYTNATGVDCMVYVAGGTVTAIAVAGTATGLTSGGVWVPAGSTITLTYSVAPTWQWFGD